MKNKIVAACIAALAFGCAKVSPRAPGPVAPVAVHVTPPIDQPLPQASLDAGVDFDGEPTTPAEVVGLSHRDKSHVDHLARAGDLREQGDLEGAFAEARRAVFDAPEDEDALFQAASLAKLVHQRDIAIAAFERLARVRADDPQPLIQEGRLLLQKHDDDGAIDVAQDALVRDDENAEPYQLAGRAHLHQGQLKEAIDDFTRCLEIDPTQAYAMNNLGFAYLRANENEKALEFLVEAAELLPNVAYVQNNLGVALERLGRIDEAKLAYGRATSLSPRYVKAQLNENRVKKVAKADQEDGSPLPRQPIPSSDADE